jgi:hypothetical protein
MYELHFVYHDQIDLVRFVKEFPNLPFQRDPVAGPTFHPSMQFVRTDAKITVGLLAIHENRPEFKPLIREDKESGIYGHRDPYEPQGPRDTFFIGSHSGTSKSNLRLF